MSRTGFSPKDLGKTAVKLLDMRPDPVPRYRLLRDVLRLDAGDPALRDAAAALESSRNGSVFWKAAGTAVLALLSKCFDGS
jgi:hypothetical protein